MHSREDSESFTNVKDGGFSVRAGPSTGCAWRTGRRVPPLVACVRRAMQCRRSLLRASNVAAACRRSSPCALCNAAARRCVRPTLPPRAAAACAGAQSSAAFCVRCLPRCERVRPERCFAPAWIICASRGVPPRPHVKKRYDAGSFLHSVMQARLRIFAYIPKGGFHGSARLR